MNQGAATCVVCKRVAYPMERLMADGKAIHTSCFKCTECGVRLHQGSTRSGFAMTGDQPFCQMHYQERFVRGVKSGHFKRKSVTSGHSGSLSPNVGPVRESLVSREMQEKNEQSLAQQNHTFGDADGAMPVGAEQYGYEEDIAMPQY